MTIATLTLWAMCAVFVRSGGIAADKFVEAGALGMRIDLFRRCCQLAEDIVTL
jgi:hypothetical protein